MNTRKDKAKETEQKLIDSASELIKEKGINNISIEDITNKANVAKGTFYTYFKKKEDIVEVICYKNFFDITNKILNLENKTLIEKVSIYIVDVLKEIENSGIETCRSWTSTVLKGKNNLLEVSKYDVDVKNLEMILNQYLNNKVLIKNTPIHELSMLIINEIYGCMLAWCMNDSKEGLVKSLSWFNESYLLDIFKNYIKEN